MRNELTVELPTNGEGPEEAVGNGQGRVTLHRYGSAVMVAGAYLGLAVLHIGIEAFIMLPGATWDDQMALGLTRNLLLPLFRFVGIFIVPAVALPIVFLKLVFADAGRRLPAATLLLVIVGGALVLFAVYDWGIDVRRAGLRRFATRAQTVVQAIHSYERDHGLPPASLGAIVPRYASTDVLRRFRFRACKAPQYRVLPQYERLHLPSWEIEFACPNLGSMALDRLQYRSMPIYESGPGQERFGGWLYTWD